MPTAPGRWRICGAARPAHRPRLDRLCVRRAPAKPLSRDGRTQPANGLRQLQAGRRGARSRCQSAAPDPAHVVGVQPLWAQLRQDHAAPGRGRPELRVVADQTGCPTYAADLAAAILAMARRLPSMGSEAMPWGVYHVAGRGAATWHAFAECIVGTAAAHYGLRPTVVHPITTPDFPTPAQRPANSQLDCSKLASVLDLRLPQRTDGVSRCLAQICANAGPAPAPMSAIRP